jgi:hypothetical protein
LADGAVSVRGRLPDPGPGVDWTGFRGINGADVAEGATPTAWNVPRDEGVAWTTLLDGAELIGNRRC